ncbi:MAG: two-component sensor histidine kinase [Gemmataceae bacterium]
MSSANKAFPTAPLPVPETQLVQAHKLLNIGLIASSVAHEFNNILTTIINQARLGLEYTDGRQKNECLERILKVSQRAASLTGTMLGLVRRTGPEKQKADLVALVEETLLLVEKDLAKHRIRVHKEYQGRPHAWVCPGQIQQLLLNLIINAQQAMVQGGSLTLGVRENRPLHMAEIIVADTGCGIPADKLRTIFQPFYTTKQPNATGQGGTGLGLCICRQIIEEHHGRIRVESLVGKGTTFTVRLPLEAAERAGDQVRAAS